eukprot:9944299-Heterocapsa_arctica.AAC.1
MFRPVSKPRTLHVRCNQTASQGALRERVSALSSARKGVQMELQQALARAEAAESAHVVAEQRAA